MNSRSIKRKTCIHCHVSKFCSNVSACMCVRSDVSSLLQPILCFLPNLKWVVGAFQHLSITEKDEEKEEGWQRRIEEAFLQ